MKTFFTAYILVAFFVQHIALPVVLKEEIRPQANGFVLEEKTARGCCCTGDSHEGCTCGCNLEIPFSESGDVTAACHPLSEPSNAKFIHIVFDKSFLLFTPTRQRHFAHELEFAGYGFNYSTDFVRPIFHPPQSQA